MFGADGAASTIIASCAGGVLFKLVSAGAATTTAGATAVDTFASTATVGGVVGVSLATGVSFEGSTSVAGGAAGDGGGRAGSTILSEIISSADLRRLGVLSTTEAADGAGARDLFVGVSAAATAALATDESDEYAGAPAGGEAAPTWWIEIISKADRRRFGVDSTGRGAAVVVVGADEAAEEGAASEDAATGAAAGTMVLAADWIGCNVPRLSSATTIGTAAGSNACASESGAAAADEVGA